MKRSVTLTDIEVKVMRTLWDSKEPLTIAEMAKRLEREKISAASVGQAIKKLLGKNAVMVKEYIPSANVYARAFVPVFDREDFLAMEFKRLHKNVFGDNNTGMEAIVTKLLTVDKKASREQIKEIQAVIDKSLEKYNRNKEKK